MCDFEVHPIGTGKLLAEAVNEFREQVLRGENTDGDVDRAVQVGPIECEIDGEPVAGAVWASIEIDAHGDACLMLFTDPIVAAHVAGGAFLPPSDATAEGD